MTLSGQDEMSGYLHKRRGGFGKHMPNAWQPRYFIVRDGWMYYFEEKKLNARPRGKIDLQSELVTLVVNLHFEQSPSPHTLLINPGGYEEKWKLCAANSDDMEQWCNCINSYINNEHKRKPAKLLLPVYHSDNDDDEDCSETSDEGSISLDRLSSKDPHSDLPFLSSTSPKNNMKSPRNVSFETTDKLNVKASSAAVAAATTSKPKANTKVKDINPGKATAKFRSPDISDTSETVLTLLLMNLCAIFAILTDKILLKAAYSILGNVVMVHTLYLRSNRVDKQNKELKTLTTAKDKSEGMVTKLTAKVATLEQTVAGAAPVSAGSGTGALFLAEDTVVEKAPRAPGTTIKQVHGTPADEDPHTWCRCDPTAFNVRCGPNYRSVVLPLLFASVMKSGRFACM